jgi:hypothetical protein
MGEPDWALESVHYYSDNPIYIVREGRFGTTVRFVRGVRTELSLSELLQVARDVQRREGREVLIALGNLRELDPKSDRASEVRSVTYPYGRLFTWSAEELRAWNACTEAVQTFADNVIGDERYTVYRLARDDSSGNPSCRD